MTARLLLSLSLAWVAALVRVCSAASDPVFSGPQPAEKLTPFQVIEINGAAAGSPRRILEGGSGRPLAMVFLHGLERSLVPLLRVIDEYGALRQDRLQTEIVFLAADRIAGEQRIKAATTSLKLKSPVGLSVDGAEGPGNYGLNKDCLMTILVATNRQVAANFALIQPGIADAPKVLEALARSCGDTNPPTATQLSERTRGPAGAGEPTERRKTEGEKAANPKKEPFPGAVPTDGKLQGLLRSFIRKTNDIAAVDQILADVRTHIHGNPDLQKQAIDGWIRILHFGDRYGTDYARKKGQEFLSELQSPRRP